MAKKKKVGHLIREGDLDEGFSAQNFNITKAAHPFACIFHVLFKGSAVGAFMFMGLFTTSDVRIFVVTMMSTCLDFWVVKNITGRKLIGLRWWSASDLLREDFEEVPTEIEKQLAEKEMKNLNQKEEKKNESEEEDSDSDDSEEEENDPGAPLIEEWYFESYDSDVKNSQVDAYIFWTSQLSATIFWLIFVIVKAISFSIFWGMLVFVCFSLSGVNTWAYYKCSKNHEDKLSVLKRMRGSIQRAAMSIAGNSD